MREIFAKLLRRRRRAYRRTFGTREGQAVLADLRNFCCATRPSFQPGDPYATALREGRREVWAAPADASQHDREADLATRQRCRSGVSKPIE